MNDIPKNPTELFERIITYFREEPCRLNMETWQSNFLFPEIGSTNKENPLIPPCGTIGCLAFAAVFCSGLTKLNGNIPSTAKRLLQLTDEEADKLFYTDGWPEPMKSDHERCLNDFEKHKIMYRAGRGDLEAIAIGKYLRERMAWSLIARVNYFILCRR